MNRIGNLREDFDPSMNFFVVKALTIFGKVWQPGQQIDKGLVEPRRLRQLYETRYLRQEFPPIQEVREEKEKPIVEIGFVPDRDKQAAAQPPKKADKIKAAKRKARAA